MEDRVMAEKRLLFVEDNSNQQALYKALSKRFGFKAQLVSNCREALKACQENEMYDLILMDMSLEEIDGCQCTGMIRDMNDLGKNVPIVAVTGHVSDEYRVRCIESGMNDFLPKPFGVDDFGAMLDKWTKSQPE
jgi:CheY-like chemotaxis protein